MKPKNTPSLQLRNSINRSPWRGGVFFLPLALVCFGLSPAAHAVSPPPDGGYPGQNTAEGQQALLSLTSGLWNTALGFQALKSDTSGNSNTATGGRALFSNTTGIQNTANGAFALLANTVGGGNSAFGFQALTSNTTGSGNTANGHQALASNTTGGSNTAVGVAALSDNTTGVHNTGIGAGALASNTTGGSNTAVGEDALSDNTTGDNNTANGDDALTDNTTGESNTAIGARALFNNTTGSRNTANGIAALRDNTDGGDNTANGAGALLMNETGSSNTAVGFQALSHNNGSHNIALGFFAGSAVTTGSNNVHIGNSGASVDSKTIRIGTDVIHDRTFIAGIRGTTTQNANAIPVVIDSAGQLGTMSSSRRFKNEIKPMDKTSEAILGLKPVTFHYKSDGANIPQFGLVAEEVAEVNPNLVVRDEKGEIYSVRYEAVNAMLLNEFLKEHKRGEQQQATITDLKSTVAQQQKQIDALTAGLQKVSTQLELSKSAPQTVLNNR